MSFNIAANKKDVWWLNERIVEIPFIHRNLPPAEGAKLLDFGCTRSLLALELAAIGYKVTGVDLRPYPPIKMRNFEFRKGDLRRVVKENEFDAAISVSVIEHIGLGAYGDKKDGPPMRKAVVEAFVRSVKSGGKLLVTVPVGMSSTNKTLQCFTPSEAESLLPDCTLTQIEYYSRKRPTDWTPCSRDEVSLVNNDNNHRGPMGGGGLNSVGCFVWTKN